jgi:hypothetical protein
MSSHLSERDKAMLEIWKGNERRARRYLGWATLIAACIIAAFVLGGGSSCSVQEKDEPAAAAGPDAPIPPTVPCGDLRVGQARTEACQEGSAEGGERILVCTEAGLKVANDTCEAAGGDEGGSAAGCDGITTFEDIAPILTSSCKGCHSGYDSFPIAKARAAAYIDRVNLPANNPRHMPKGGDLAPADKAALTKWRDDGLKRAADCQAQGGGGGSGGGAAVPSFAAFERGVIADLLDASLVDEDERDTTIYFDASHRLVAGATDAELETFKQALEKGLNSISLEPEVKRVRTVAKGVWAIDLEEWGLEDKWALVENADKVRLESKTSTGVIIKALTGRARPWWPVETVLDVLMRDSPVYYELTETAGTFLEQMDLRDFDAQLIGLDDSRLAPQHNRLISRFECDDGPVYVTFDTDAFDDPNKSLKKAPLLADAGTRVPFVFEASEILYLLPNGMLAGALFNAAGLRQDVAPTSTVFDYRSPVSIEIRNFDRCTGCHNAGFIPATDFVRNAVVGNAAEYDALDIRKVKELYRSAEKNVATFEADNARFAQALEELEIDPALPDPLTDGVGDEYQLSWDVAKAGAFLWLSPAELAACINSSSALIQQVGQLGQVDAGDVPFEQWVAALAVIQIDCDNVFKDPVGS